LPLTRSAPCRKNVCMHAWMGVPLTRSAPCSENTAIARQVPGLRMAMADPELTDGHAPGWPLLYRAIFALDKVAVKF